MLRSAWLAFGLVWVLSACAAAKDGNTLAYLQDPVDPYYVGRSFPKLTTPQWVGEDAVEAVVVLAIDDMRDTAKYEQYLRPILDRLKQIDGRAPVSIMTNSVDPQDAQLRHWLEEGVSIEVHTIDHPCPCLAGGDFQQAKSTYEHCVDLLNEVSGNRPVAFRMPCCDSLNTPSPRFWAEIFNQTTPQGNYLAIDSSVFNITTSEDRQLPRQIVIDDGQERFGKYLPFPSFVNTIEDYPYPYVIGSLCWEFPCVVPSDWEAQNLHRPNNPRTVEDLKAALDAVVIKQGVFNLVFHPHGWIRSEQVVEFIDYASRTYQGKVKFLNFREALERMNRNLLVGNPLRPSGQTQSHVRLLDVNNDGFLDVFVHEGDEAITRVWSATKGEWTQCRQPWPYRDQRFFLHASDAVASAVAVPKEGGLVHLLFRGDKWTESELDCQVSELATTWSSLLAAPQQLDGFLVRDFNRDGQVELLLAKDGETLILAADETNRSYRPLTWTLPRGVRFVSPKGGDAGLRFVDVDGDGFDDCLFSDGQRYSLHLFESIDTGWTQEVISAWRKDPSQPGRMIPMVVRPDGTNNGAWFHSKSMWVQNEDTDRLPDSVDRLSFAHMLDGQVASGRIPNLPTQTDQPKERQVGKPAPRTSFTTPPNPQWGGWPGPMRPEQSRAAIHTPPGTKAELVAAEPLVADPIAFDWGPDGRLWVVEMRDYPNGMDGQGKPGGRVKVLEDDDGDGRYDRAHIFLDDVAFPTGVKVWRKGILVTAAPEVFYAEDTDDDGVADVRQTLYRGFTEGNQQHRVNGLRWGVDGWLYLGNGDSGGVVESVKTGQKVDVRGRDLRIRPDDGAIEAIAGQTQYGRDCDDFGNWFGGNNSDPMWHYVLEERYLGRNPHFAPPSLKKQVSVQPGPAPVFPESETVERFNDFDRADRFTSACSPMVYRDILIGDESTRYSFVCEPVHNLVHREVIRPDGVSFTSQRSAEDQTSEFVASEDNWFRPVMVRTGPDGALWIADMYRLVIEHPEWIPASWQARLDVRAGDTMGRIYRVRDTTPTRQNLRKVPQFDRLSSLDLVKALDTQNGPQRDMAHQLLLWRGDREVIEPLRQAALKSNCPQAEIHSLYLLDEFDALSEELLTAKIAGSDADVARHAMRIAEQFLKQWPALGEAMLGQLDSLDMQVKLQLACSLGEWDDPRAADALAKIALAHGGDPHMLVAVASSLNPHNVGGVLTAIHTGSATASQRDVLARLLPQAIYMGDDAARRFAFEVVRPSSAERPVEWRFRALRQLMIAVRREQSSSTLEAEQQKLVTGMLAEARRMAIDATADSATRLAAIQMLGLDATSSSDDLTTLYELVTPQNPIEVQLQSLESLQRLSAPETPARLLQLIDSYSPRVRHRIMDLVLSRDAWAEQVLEEVKSGRLPVLYFDARRRQQLANHSNDAVRRLAEDLFASTDDSNRSDVVKEYSDVAGQDGDAQRGRLVFGKICANCHRVEGIGHAVGPDLKALSNKSAEALLIAILDPNRSVEAPFVEFTVATMDGLLHSGIVSSESSSGITLTGLEGKTQTILRDDIEVFRSTGKSLMPEGVEKDLTRVDLADLLAFLRSPADVPKHFAGNQPQLAPVRDDGSIRLFAVHAEIYGPTLVFEPHYNNLGYWQDTGDRAVWKVKAKRPGRYRVSLDYACDNASAGNQYLLSLGDQQLSGEVTGTGTWDDYGRLNAGTLELPEVETEIVFRSAGPIQSYLMDLRTIYLYPVD